MIIILFYDFEVFKEDWLLVVLDVTNRKEFVFINDPEGLEKFHAENKHDIWAGFNSRHYDQWILKAILCGFDPKKVNDYIIARGNPGWKFSSLFRNIPLNNYDVMLNTDRGLKSFEGFMGNDIKETSVPFDVDRKLTQKEIEETIQYCRHDVEQMIEVFLKKEANDEQFSAHMGLVKLACGDRPLDLSLISKTKPQLSAIILNAAQHEYNDEFDIDFPSTMRIEKYTAVLDWYKNPENRCYEKNGKKNQLDIEIADVPHQFGYGGLHGALAKYHGEGFYLNMDVVSLYPSLMIKYGLGSRSIKDPAKYEQIYNQRLQYKREGNPLQLSLKLVLNSTYGVMKDKNNTLYDPLQANRVCIYGQIFLLDLMERLESHCQIIQSNTDGVLIKLNRYEDYELIDDICFEWEERTRLQLEFEEFSSVFQKDVNNYIIIPNGNPFDEKGKARWKSKGAYVKKLSPLDYDLPIVNHALVSYMVHGIPLEETILKCDDLKEFQLVTKISGKYTYILHGDEEIKEKCIRVFASNDKRDEGVKKVHAKTGRPAKLLNSPESCFIWNENVNGAKCPSKLNKQWYLEMARKRLGDFGI